jgi:hypothetical protein
VHFVIRPKAHRASLALPRPSIACGPTAAAAQPAHAHCSAPVPGPARPSGHHSGAAQKRALRPGPATQKPSRTAPSAQRRPSHKGPARSLVSSRAQATTWAWAGNYFARLGQNCPGCSQPSISQESHRTAGRAYRLNKTGSSSLRKP